MKKLYTLIGIFGLSISGSLFGQLIMPTGNPTPLSSTTIPCGSTTVFVDNGNAGNYTNTQNEFITICPGTAGQFVRITFTAFSTETDHDFLVIFDGNDPSAAVVGVYHGGALPPSFTSSDPSGCLSFRFFSDGGTTSSGWSANLTCVGAAGTPPVSSSQNCGGGQGITICSNATLPGNSLGFGMDELEAGPPGGAGSSAWEGCLLSGEQQASWYYFSPTTNGVIAFIITPSVGSTDYDWAIWGPAAPGNPTPCPAFTGLPPIRCSYARIGCTNASGQTGMQAPNADVSEPQGNFSCNGGVVNAFVAPLNVLAGEVYVMLIDNFAATGTPFSIAFTGTTATLDCTPLPIVLDKFDAKADDNSNLVYWTTATEQNNDFFTVEKSEDGIVWTEMGRMNGAGNSNVLNNYTMVDPVPYKTTYYRLTQTDFNGTRLTFNPVVVNRGDNGGAGGEIFGFYPNPAQDIINVQTFNDGENKLTIRDQTGKDVFQAIINGKSLQTINFDKTVSSGLYFITIENNGNVQNEKILFTGGK